MRKFGSIPVLLHTQMHVKCECQSEILLKRLVPTHPRSTKITTKRSSKTIRTQHNVFVCY